MSGILLRSIVPSELTQSGLGGELNKVAANIATGRNMAGVHWRTDYTQAVRLGEEVVIGVLREAKEALLMDAVFSPGRFDGTAMTV